MGGECLRFHLPSGDRSESVVGEEILPENSHPSVVAHDPSSVRSWSRRGGAYGEPAIVARDNSYSGAGSICTTLSYPR